MVGSTEFWSLNLSLAKRALYRLSYTPAWMLQSWKNPRVLEHRTRPNLPFHFRFVFSKTSTSGDLLEFPWDLPRTIDPLCSPSPREMVYRPEQYPFVWRTIDPLFFLAPDWLPYPVHYYNYSHAVRTLIC